MKYLLDTHTAIWYLEDMPKIPPKTKEIIKLPDNNIYKGFLHYHISTKTHLTA